MPRQTRTSLTRDLQEIHGGKLPKYTTRIDYLLFEEHVKRMYVLSATKEEACLISIFWRTAARTSEALKLVGADVNYNEETVSIRIPTLKLRSEQRFYTAERVLSFTRPSGRTMDLYLETIIKYVSEMPSDKRLFPHTARWASRVINRLSKRAFNKTLSCMHFRHSVMSWLARNGATVAELMHFKGSRDVKSISAYVHAVPYIVGVQAMQARSMKGGPRLMGSEPPPKIFPVLEGSEESRRHERVPEDEEEEKQIVNDIKEAIKQAEELKRKMEDTSI